MELVPPIYNVHSYPPPPPQNLGKMLSTWQNTLSSMEYPFCMYLKFFQKNSVHRNEQ